MFGLTPTRIARASFKRPGVVDPDLRELPAQLAVDDASSGRRASRATPARRRRGRNWNPDWPDQPLAPSVSPRIATYSRRPVTPGLPTLDSEPFCRPSRMPSSAVNSAGVEWRDDVRAIAPAAADLAVHARADLEPRRRDDDRVDEGALDAVVDRRLVPLVDDADRHQQHPGADVERAVRAGSRRTPVPVRARPSPRAPRRTACSSSSSPTNRMRRRSCA